MLSRYGYTQNVNEELDVVREAAAIQRRLRGLVSRKLVLTTVHPLNVAMVGIMTSLVCLVYGTSLVVRQVSTSTSARVWISEATNVCIMAAAMLYVMSHVMVLIERHLAGSQPLLHARLVTRYGGCRLQLNTISPDVAVIADRTACSSKIG